MNREIKFRAYSLSSESMNYLNPKHPDGFSFGCLAEDEYWKVMQFTGLKDKNGVEIYEGDIVKKWHYEYNCGGMGDKIIHAIVEYKENEFTNIIDRSRGVEVIGNIYENPELMDKEK